MTKTEIMDNLYRWKEFMDVCPCCGAPLIIEKHGIYYSVREFDEIDFDEKETVDN